MLTPADIDGKQFSTTRLKEGYDQAEVDTFLDRVQEDYAFLSQQVARLDEENRVLRRKAEYASNDAQTSLIPPVPSAAPEKPSVIAERMLAAAEQAAREHEADALAKAEEVVRTAGAQGAQLIEDATAAAEKIKSEGLAEKYRRNDELEAKITVNQNTLAEIKSNGENIRRAMAEALARYESGVQS